MEVPEGVMLNAPPSLDCACTLSPGAYIMGSSLYLDMDRRLPWKSAAPTLMIGNVLS